MSKHRLLIAFLIPLTASLIGCGGSDGDNVNITNDFRPVDPIVPVDPPVDPGTGNCAKVVRANFRSAF